MKTLTKDKSAGARKSVYRRLEEVIGCKWSVSVLMAVRAGVRRPGQLERCIEGISTKVLAERLRKLTAYGLLSRDVFAEMPPRTEYQLTEKGRELTRIIEQIHALDQRG
ncbi:winged helix-turn-helix transcriptional regulator [Geoalkalibacter sp.]|uniref:winged helix-turn-helix transcriptional regulator n=1 Tax=Geoalkalibacter sp. TaxID=3041440 RepID=UPI00272E8A5F|nr:helix-turn-helix domain-containing protein [Geoalkalibacter sp.]